MGRSAHPIHPRPIKGKSNPKTRAPPSAPEKAKIMFEVMDACKARDAGKFRKAFAKMDDEQKASYRESVGDRERIWMQKAGIAI